MDLNTERQLVRTGSPDVLVAHLAQISMPERSALLQALVALGRDDAVAAVVNGPRWPGHAYKVRRPWREAAQRAAELGQASCLAVLAEALDRFEDRDWWVPAAIAAAHGHHMAALRALQPDLMPAERLVLLKILPTQAATPPEALRVLTEGKTAGLREALVTAVSHGRADLIPAIGSFEARGAESLALPRLTDLVRAQGRAQALATRPALPGQPRPRYRA